MFIAHLPAGYLLTKTLLPKRNAPRGALLLTGLFFSVAPDLDLLWFYTLGMRGVPHHQYVTHWPVFWLGLAAVFFSLALLLRKPSWHAFIAVGLANALLHLILDSVAAEIYWLAPFSDLAVQLVNVPARHAWWVKNFLLHWTFALEIGICLLAAAFFLKNTSARKVQPDEGPRPPCRQKQGRA